MPAKKAAIDIDDMLDVPIEKMTGADLLQCLNHATKIDPKIGTIFADKKKFELWIDEGPVVKITLRELLDRLQREKKKVELELDVNAIDVPDLLVERVADALVERGIGR